MTCPFDKIKFLLINHSFIFMLLSETDILQFLANSKQAWLSTTSWTFDFPVGCLWHSILAFVTTKTITSYTSLRTEVQRLGAKFCKVKHYVS